MPTVTRYATADRQSGVGVNGGGSWNAPENARSATEPSESEFASVALTSNQESETRAYRNFQLLVEDGGVIPVGATINSVTAEYRCQVSLSTGALDNVTGAVDCTLLDDGTIVDNGSFGHATVRTTSGWNTVSLGTGVTFSRDDLAHGVGGDTLELGIRGREHVGGGGLGTATPRVAWVRVTVDYTDPPDTTAPATPTGLTATIGDTRVDLNWNGNSEPDLGGYRLYRNGVLIYDGPLTQFQDTGLTNGTTYTYTVSAYDDSLNESAQSAGVQATPVEMRLPSSTLYPSSAVLPGPAPTGTPQALTASIVSTSDLGAQLRARSPLSASPSGAVDLGAQLRLRSRMTAAPAGSSDLGAQLRLRTRLSSNPSGTSDLSASPRARTGLASDLSASGNLGATLTARVFLSANPAALGSLAAVLRARTFLIANPEAAGDLDSALHAASQLAAAFTGSGDLSAALHTQGAFEVNIVASSDFSAELRTRSRLTAAPSAVANLNAALRQRAHLTAALGAAAALASTLQTQVPYIHFKPPLDGSVISVLANGNIIVQTDDGSIVEVTAAGEVIERNNLGSVVAPALGGSVVGPALNGTVVGPALNGTVVGPSLAGTVIAVVAAGAVVEKSLGGAVIGKDANGGAVEVATDGTVEEVQADGTVSDYNAGGTLA